MLSKSTIKHIRQLQQKKYRKLHGQYVIEGEKIILDAINLGVSIDGLWITSKMAEKHELKIPYEITTENELLVAGSLKSNNAGLAVVNFKNLNIDWEKIANSFFIILDGVNDPGNLGTIIRTANWYGIKNIICTSDVVDYTNPKVLQASMGAIFNVDLYYLEPDLISDNLEKHQIPTFLTDMEGESIRELRPVNKGALIMGNEANGVRLSPNNAKKITIPKHLNSTAESLNVAVSFAICCERLLFK